MSTAPPGIEQEGQDGVDGHLLLIGWRNQAVPAVNALGCRVTWVVTPGEAAQVRDEGFTQDLVLVADPTNPEQILAGLARSGYTLAGFTAVGSDLEFTLVAASVVGELAGARCLPVRTAVLLRDKVAQKNALRAAGLPVADTLAIGDLGELAEPPMSPPFVVKPPLGAGTTDTWVLRDEAEIAALLGSRGRDTAGPWAVESFVTGHEVQIDGVVRGGRVVRLAVSRYLQNLILIREGAVNASVVLDPDRYAVMYERAHELVARSLEILEHRDGVFHMEAFDQGDRLVFSECGGRTGGALTRQQLGRQFGLDLMDEWARSLVGLPAGVLDEYRSEHVYGYTLLLPPEGRIEHVPDLKEVLGRPGVVEGSVSLKKGDVWGRLLHSSQRAGRVLVRGADEEELVTRLHDIGEWFRSAVVVSPVP
ncbi:hypothetical protein K7395_18655 [Streptomyces filamentosus]|uniref:ATP-grasp domain-containing protein n=2 Tax=Streptomyces filamentosus TaxID=67294 RepID=A0ABY4V2X8_STRFL|nr:MULTISPECIES: hypothetical protein [Streptomyces]EFE75803.1 predicted protein [Streptomyces filamentosus NRRL 15998]ESU48723.1 hypothetical protein P376_3296 [Streptomyces sp. HCCB10043]EWS92821.1 hypothetical protein SSIG_03362 [Streptomyces filamentosus NRRL 11379]MYR79847.1 hypothetical protein [Streptomyces sp. SID5466]USC48606.1 hypothetical protein K7395_18655 [Streptomyces filamentosus]